MNMYSFKLTELPALPECSVSFRDEVRQFFESYSSLYYKDDPVYNQHIELKQVHINKVCEEITGMGVALGMNTEQLAFVEIIALLHDIGRFEQFERYRTFSDAESENHAKIALRIIDSKGLLKGIEPQIQKIILHTILNHNHPIVPDNESSLIDFYSRLLRDADKLDIWRIAIETYIFYKINTESLPDMYEVPDALFECFEQNRIITLEMVDSFYDSILFRLGWIFDINLTYTLKSANERNIFNKLMNKLPSSERLNKIFQIIDQYIRSNI